VPEKFQKVKLVKELPEIKRVDGQLTYRDAIKEALIEEMKRDHRVIFYGEDVPTTAAHSSSPKDSWRDSAGTGFQLPDFGGGDLQYGGRRRHARPAAGVELMYMDFALMASDAISNQAAKWHYMSGAKAEISMVIRASVGGGKGYGGQHSQTLESIFAHIPGLYVVYPSTPMTPRACSSRRSGTTTR